MTTIADILSFLDTYAPPSLQESYDNAGLLVGDQGAEVTGVLISLDCTEEVVEEAVAKGCNLIVSHHPIIFGGLKRLTGKNYIERTVIKAIQNNVALYASHTNMDNVQNGVNQHFCDVLGLQHCRILHPKSDLRKLTVFTPKKATEKVLGALGKAGAGQIGNYKHCSFTTEGTGRFQPNERANPHIGSSGVLESVNEDRIEVLFPKSHTSGVLNAMRAAHPYEEVAYYLHELENTNQETGSGMVGTLAEPLPVKTFFKTLKSQLDLQVVKHTQWVKETISTVAVCGGAGSFLLKSAIGVRADVFVSSDFKYHEYFDAEDKIIIADVGHYESEVRTKDLFYRILTEKFPNIALHLTSIVTNPVQYF